MDKHSRYQFLTVFCLFLLLTSCAAKSVTQPASEASSTMPAATPVSSQQSQTVVSAEPKTVPPVKPVTPEPSVSITKETLSPQPQAATTPHFSEDSPIGVIQKYEDEIRSIINRYQGKTSKAAVSERDRVLGKQLRKYFDFEELARLTLSNHWSNLNTTQRQRFINTFVQLIERSFLNKTREIIAGYKVVYEDQKIEKSRAQVNSAIKKQDVDVKVAYELKRVSAKAAQIESTWKIYNVVYDNFDLLGNYKSQFNRIISQKSFNELMRTMENRLKNPAETVKL